MPCSGNNALYGFQVGLAHDTRDNAFLATEGHLMQASFEESVGTFNFPRAEIERPASSSSSTSSSTIPAGTC